MAIEVLVGLVSFLGLVLSWAVLPGGRAASVTDSDTEAAPALRGAAEPAGSR